MSRKSNKLNLNVNNELNIINEKWHIANNEWLIENRQNLYVYKRFRK